MLQADVPLNFVVDRISINRNGSALLLSGSDGLCIMYLYGRTSTTDNTIICRYGKNSCLFPDLSFFALFFFDRQINSVLVKRNITT